MPNPQKGCWPYEIVDVLAKRIARRRRPGRSRWEHSDVRSECRAIARRDLAALSEHVLPVELVEGLVEALETGHAALDAHLDATPEEQEANWTNAHTALSRMHSALASYRQAMGEGQ